MPASENVRAFTRQAESFERPGSHFGDTAMLDWIASSLRLDGARVLDVAGGTGKVARHLADTALLSVVCDLTPQMLATGRDAAAAEDRRNVVFVQGDAAALPFADDQFDVVVSRVALHHIEDVPRVVAEMARVCAAGGHVSVIDSTAPDGALGERLDELERLRDPSHVAFPRAEQLTAAFADARLAVSHRDVRAQAIDGVDWLDRGHPEPDARAEVLAAIEAELDGAGAPTGLEPARDGDGFTVVHHHLMLVGSVASH